jgi:23S rRNA (cytosine1962-C5)-methyltransferase
MSRFTAVAEMLPAAVDGSDARRLFHGRGRCHAGLEHVSIDWFQPALLVTLFSPEPELDELVALLRGWGEPLGVEGIAVQRRDLDGAPLATAWGVLPRKPVAVENGLRFGIQLGGRQNPGFFLDMAQARRWLENVVAGRSVLNLFAYTCAFSVVARRAGASRVVNLDMSAAALRQGQQNHQRNSLPGDVRYLPHDLFRSWARLGRDGPYDVVIVDPPSRQPGSFVAERDYPRVVRRLPGLCAEGADVLLCLNSPHLGPGFLLEMAQSEAPGLAFVERLPNPAAFRDVDEEASLKVLHFRCGEPGA